jgi:hypothetical protein
MTSPDPGKRRAMNGRSHCVPTILAAVAYVAGIVVLGSCASAMQAGPSKDVKQAYAELLEFSKCDRKVEQEPKLFPNPTLKRPQNPDMEAVTATHNAMTVPIASLIPAPTGKYHVQVPGPDNTQRDVAVEIGSFDVITGRVQVAGALTPGQQVVVRYATVIDHGGAFLAIPQLFHLQSRAFRQAAAECGSERLKLGL